MSNLLFLIVPAAIAGLAVTFVWLRNRPETSPTAGIDRFSGQMAALAPETEPEVDTRSAGVRVQSVDPRPAAGQSPPDEPDDGAGP